MSLSRAGSLALYRRLPSDLYRDSVSRGGLSPDASQLAALPPLDALVAELPAFLNARSAYVAARRRAAAAVADEAALLRAEGAVKRAWRRTLGTRQKDALAAVAESAEVREGCGRPPDAPKGVFLWGAVGSGKTTLVELLFGAVGGLLPREAAVAVHFQEFMNCVYERIHVYDGMGESERERYGFAHPLDAVVDAVDDPEHGLGFGPGVVGGREGGEGGLLVFDEFQVTDTGDARLLQGCLERFMSRGIAVVMTSNRPPFDVDRNQLDHCRDLRRFLDFVEERCVVQRVGTGIDYRERAALEGGDGDRVAETEANCIYPEEHSSPEHLQRVWHDVAGCEWDEVVSRSVQASFGREILVRRASPLRNVAQFDAAELLYSATAPSDYIALARRFDAIFIRDVVRPPESRDVARRWVWMVDALYGNGCCLYMRVAARGPKHLLSTEGILGPDIAMIAEGSQFETELERAGVGADNRDAMGEEGSGFAASLSALYTGENEKFALKRAASRLVEMQNEEYRVRHLQRLGVQ